MIEIITLVLSALSVLIGLISLFESFVSKIAKVDIEFQRHKNLEYENAEVLTFYINNYSSNAAFIESFEYFSKGKKVKSIYIDRDMKRNADELPYFPANDQLYAGNNFVEGSNVDKIVIKSFSMINGFSKVATFNVPEVNLDE